MESQAPAPQESLTIKEVAEATGLAPATIRYYDQQFEEYLNVTRGARRQRLFTPEALQRLMEVRRLLKDEGLSIRQARQRLAGQEGGVVSARSDPGVQAELKRLQEDVASLKAQVQELKDIQRRTLALIDGLTN